MTQHALSPQPKLFLFLTCLWVLGLPGFLPAETPASKSERATKSERASAEKLTPGAAFLVNSYTPSPQFSPAVAMAPDGRFVATWASGPTGGTDSSAASIQGQLYDSSGAAVGGQFQVNTETTGRQVTPSVAMDHSGRFMVTWSSEAAGGQDIQMQRYGSDGTPLGSEVRVNDSAVGLHYDPSVTAEPDGDFVVTWDSGVSVGDDSDGYSIQGKRFASDGTPRGAQFQVNSDTPGYQYYSSVAVAPDGRFTVTWESDSTAGGYGIMGRRFASDGNPVGGDFQINSLTANGQYSTEVGMDAQGRFTVVWQSYGSLGTDSDGSSIQLQRYDADGTPLGAQAQVNVVETSDQFRPDIAVNPLGEFHVVWSSGTGVRGTGGGGGSPQVVVRPFDAEGNPTGGEIVLTAGGTPNPRIAMGETQTAVVWGDESGAVDDPDNGIRASILTADADLSVTLIDGVTSVVPGTSVTYDLVAGNAGPDIAYGASLSAAFSTDLDCTWTSLASGGASGNTSGSGDILDTLDLPVGASVDYTITCAVDPAATGSTTQTAMISGGANDATPSDANASDTNTLTPMADLSLAMDAAPDPAVPGGTVTYTLTADNAGPSNSSGGTITDVLPADLAFMTSGDCTAIGQTVTCAVGPLAVGESGIVSFTAQILGTASSIDNSASLVGNEPDPGGANNAGSASITVSGPSTAVDIPTLGTLGSLLLGLGLTLLGLGTLRRL